MAETHRLGCLVGRDSVTAITLAITQHRPCRLLLILSRVRGVQPRLCVGQQVGITAKQFAQLVPHLPVIRAAGHLGGSLGCHIGGRIGSRSITSRFSRRCRGLRRLRSTQVHISLNTALVAVLEPQPHTRRAIAIAANHLGSVQLTRQMAST